MKDLLIPVKIKEPLVEPVNKNFSYLCIINNQIKIKLKWQMHK